MTTQAPIDPRLFRETLGHYPTGVAVVTGIGADGQPVGMVVGSFTSVSLDPPLVGFSPTKSSRTFATLQESATFCVNVLASDQEQVCRRMAVGGPEKFDGIGWEPAPGGAPVIDDVVAWIECDWADLHDGGDHYIVLGRVRELAVARPAPPLLFFQGGYGRFTSPSLMAAADPDLLEAVRSAEKIRDQVEACSTALGLECSVTAQVAGELVTVLVANAGGTPDASTAGQRVPHIAPLGTVFLADAPEEQVEAWLRHLAGSDDETVAQLRRHLSLVRERGYSISVASDAADERRAVMAAYSSPDSLPSHARRIRELIAASVDHYEPEIVPDRSYDLYSVNVAVPGDYPGPPLAMRIMGLPSGVDGARVQQWIDGLRRCAAGAGAKLAG